MGRSAPPGEELPTLGIRSSWGWDIPPRSGQTALYEVVRHTDPGSRPYPHEPRTPPSSAPASKSRFRRHRGERKGPARTATDLQLHAGGHRRGHSVWVDFRTGETLAIPFEPHLNRPPNGDLGKSDRHTQTLVRINLLVCSLLYSTCPAPFAKFQNVSTGSRASSYAAQMLASTVISINPCVCPSGCHA